MRGVIKYRAYGFYVVTPSDDWEIDNYEEIEVIGNIFEDKEIGYTGEECIECGRVRVIKFESGKRICDKCSFDQDEKIFTDTFNY